MQNKHLKGSFFLITAVFCWGMVPLFLRSFIHEMDAWTANGFRYPFSALLWSIPFIRYYRQGKIKRNLFIATLIPAILNIFSQALWALVPYNLSPGPQAFLRTGFRFIWDCRIVFGFQGRIEVKPVSLFLARDNPMHLRICWDQSPQRKF